MKTSLFRNTAIALAVGLAGVAQAAPIFSAPDQGGTFATTPTTFVVTDTTQPVSGTASVTISTTAPSSTAGEWVFRVDQITPLNATTIGNAVEASFTGTPSNLDSQLVSESALGGQQNGTFTVDPAGTQTFDYLAVHFGGSELFVHFLTAVQTATITLANSTIGGLSNFRAYSTNVVPLPGAVWLFLSALGVFGLRRKFAGGSQAGTPTAA
jgi:hypothetical protein